MDPLSTVDRVLLLNAIALREKTMSELCAEYAATRDEIQAFVESHRDELTAIRHGADETAEVPKLGSQPTPTQLKDLWVANKFERIKRLQAVADKLFNVIENDMGDAVTIREFRSYLLLVANELGQLLSRGAGDSSEADVLRVDIAGIDMETLR